MGLEDFEKELATSKDSESRSHRERDRNEDRDRKHHRHHHRSHRHRDDTRDEERRHRHKRHRDRDDDGERRHHRKRQRSHSPDSSKPKAPIAEEEVKVFDSDDGEDDWVEKEAATAPPEEEVLDARGEDLEASKVQRDAWMQEPSALDIDYVQPRKEKAPKGQFVAAKQGHEFKVPDAPVDSTLADLQRDFDDEDDGGNVEKDEPAQHEVDYTFGDSGSSWRLTKVKAVYRQAEESKRRVDDVALERYGDLRDFDDAREEEREMDRRKMYGKDYVGLQKPSGELFQERKMEAGIRREKEAKAEELVAEGLPQGERMEELPPPSTTVPLDPTALNKLKAQLMKAQLRKAPQAAKLEEEYNLAAAASQAATHQSSVVVLNKMDTRHLDRTGEVTSLTNKRGLERGLVVENEDMSISDMVRQEKRTKNNGEGRAFAERIAKDSRFKDSLDYIDDNATQLSTHVAKSTLNLRNTAISDYTKHQRILSTCPLCHHDEKTGPAALPLTPIISLATRTYLTLPPSPTLAPGSALITPIQHHPNLLSLDADEWEEIRNFQKSLIRHYSAQDLSVLFYENASNPSTHNHASMTAIPLPHHLADTAPAYFREAILSSDEQWSQHRPILDTSPTTSRGFRKSMTPNLPYFHVWFGVDGRAAGMGHVIEDSRRWPRGDLFAREVVGGMLDLGPEIVRARARWEDKASGEMRKRVEGFRRRWGKWDWTRVLVEGGGDGS